MTINMVVIDLLAYLGKMFLTFILLTDLQMNLGLNRGLLRVQTLVLCSPGYSSLIRPQS